MKDPSPPGFEYYIDDETLRSYGKKPLVLRLRWLYMGNLLRRSYPREIVRLHERFRKRGAADPSL